LAGLPTVEVELFHDRASHRLAGHLDSALMSPRRVLVSALLFTTLLACKGAEPGETSTGKAAPAASPSTEPKVEPPVEPGVETSKAPEAGEPATETETETGEEPEPVEPLPAVFEQVGVDVCDQYITDYGKCIDGKVPEAEREAARRIVFENVSAWKQTAAAGPAGQKSLQTACRIAREQAKRATETLGCEW
jgi:hypothetical protein